MLFVVSNHKIIIIWPSPLILIIFLFKIITTLELIDKKNLGPTENQVPDPPENFRVESLTPNSATLRWDPPSSIDNILVRGYTLSYGTGSTDTRKVVLEGAENVEYTLNMLKPNTSYVLSLTAYNEAYGEDSSRLLLLIKTPLNNFQQAKDEVLEEENNKYLLNNLLLPKPSGLKVEKTGNVDEFLLYWDEPKELINENNKKKNFIYYIVQYWKDSGILKDGRIKEELHKINVEHPPALLTGIKLINSNKYLAKVKLISSNGSMSQWSEKLPLLRKSEEKINKNRWKSGGGKIIGEEVEEDFCGFELPSICDFFREGQWRWERRNSTKDGFSMVIREQLKTLKEFNLKKKKELYGRLLSPMFNLKPSETFCVSVQTKLERGGFGAIFRVGIRFESEPQPLWLYRKSLQRFWPQGEWLRLSWQLRRKLVNRGFQLIFDVSKHNEADQIKFFFSLDNLFVRASDCPIELEPFFGAAPGRE
uniref:Uncharacterized protein n=2 Tax=Meloidogyne TaxID=189290 RepID=A0A6V7XW88_MELEN|nr:unnamed protein product [Meloidogyne enterolobii]